MIVQAIVIPAVGPFDWIELTNGESDLATLQGAVGGLIQALPLPSFIQGSEKATAYINEEGKFDPACEPNMRATDFLVPGIGLMWGDYIAGSLVLAGFDLRTGKHEALPSGVEHRARLIELEAA